MIDMTSTIKPKSDQLNADDLIGGHSLTIKITGIAGKTGDQPVAISFEGDNGKPWYPCKSMRRVLVHIWGKDGHSYVGRSLTLYRDEKVTFGGIAVGGLRISHMSHMDKEVTMALTATRANKKPYTVKPLKQTQPAASGTNIKSKAEEAAKRGTATLGAFWKRLTPAQQKSLSAEKDGWKAIAAEVDKKATSSEELGDAPYIDIPPPDEEILNSVSV